MADLRKVKARIKEIAEGSRTNLLVGDIEWVVKHLGRNGYDVNARRAGDHQTLFSVGTRRFGVCTHRKGGGQLKRCYVNEFIEAMIDLGLYEEN